MKSLTISHCLLQVTILELLVDNMHHKVESFKSDLIHNNIDLKDKVGKSRHQSFKPLDYDERIAGISCLRNPIDRSISHYFHLLNNHNCHQQKNWHSIP